MITIEGQDFYNYAEALSYLFEQYGDMYTKEEVDEIISKLPKGITEEQVQTLINDALINYTTKEELTTAIEGLTRSIAAVDTRVGQTNDALSEVQDAVATLHDTKWYEHNIHLQLRSANASIQSSGSDGALVATLTLINQDPLEYTFSHNQDTSQTGPKVMKLPEAWQLLRLYRAIQLSTDKNLNLSRPCSGALVKMASASPYEPLYCINNSISTKYFDFSDTDWKRMLVVHASRVGSTYVGTYATEISVGHPTFINGQENSLWTTRDEFAAGEYNLTDSFGKSYSTYFCQQRIYCTDTVRELIGFDNILPTV